jgi:hypothetical protein
VIIDTPVNLIAGHDYVLIAETDDMADPATLRGPGGEIIVTVPSWSEPHGTEFRALYTATYFIEHDETVRASVMPDCRGDLTTLCHLSVNHTREGDSSWPTDVDAFKVRLNHAYTYVISMTGSGDDKAGYVRLVDSQGVILRNAFIVNGPLATLTIRPPQTGTYLIQSICTGDEQGSTYTLTLRIKR